MTVLFFHIPKTAGSTFHFILQRLYKKHRVFDVHGLFADECISYFKNLEDEARKKFDLVKGHQTLDLVPFIQNSKVITFLRNPVDHFLSGYFYIRNAPHNAQHKVVSRMRSIEEYIDFCLENKLINGQSLYIANNRSSSFDVDNNEELVLKKAMSTLETVDNVFVTERFEEAILILQQELNWENPFYIVLNKSKRKPDEVTPEIRERIKNIQTIDFKLYEYALKRHDWAVEDFDGSLSERIDQFRNRNQLFNLIYGKPYFLYNTGKYYLEKFGLIDVDWKIPPKYLSK